MSKIRVFWYFHVDKMIVFNLKTIILSTWKSLFEKNYFYFSISTEFSSRVYLDHLLFPRTCLFVYFSSLDEWRFFQAPNDRGEGPHNKYDELDPKRNHQVLCPKPSFILSRTRHVLWQSFQEKLFIWTIVQKLYTL